MRTKKSWLILGSDFLGVSQGWDNPGSDLFDCEVWSGNRRFFLGSFESEEEAAKEYDRAVFYLEGR